MRRGRHSSAWKNVVLSRDQQFALKRAALLRQAARAFSAHGYHDTSLDDVARRLNVTKPTLYYYFASKDEILFEAQRLGMDSADLRIKNFIQPEQFPYKAALGWEYDSGNYPLKAGVAQGHPGKEKAA